MLTVTFGAIQTLTVWIVTEYTRSLAVDLQIVQLISISCALLEAINYSIIFWTYFNLHNDTCCINVSARLLNLLCVCLIICIIIIVGEILVEQFDVMLHTYRASDQIN